MCYMRKMYSLCLIYELVVFVMSLSDNSLTGNHLTAGDFEKRRSVKEFFDSLVAGSNTQNSKSIQNQISTPRPDMPIFMPVAVPVPQQTPPTLHLSPNFGFPTNIYRPQPPPPPPLPIHSHSHSHPRLHVNYRPMESQNHNYGLPHHNHNHNHHNHNYGPPVNHPYSHVSGHQNYGQHNHPPHHSHPPQPLPTLSHSHSQPLPTLSHSQSMPSISHLHDSYHNNYGQHSVQLPELGSKPHTRPIAIAIPLPIQAFPLHVLQSNEDLNNHKHYKEYSQHNNYNDYNDGMSETTKFALFADPIYDTEEDMYDNNKNKFNIIPLNSNDK